MARVKANVAAPPVHEFVDCKVIGHAWQRFNPVMATPRYGARISLRCDRCTTERHDIVDLRTGCLDGRTYDYVEGYKETYDNPDDRPSRSDHRKMMVKRIQADLASHNALSEVMSKDELLALENDLAVHEAAGATVTQIRSRRRKVSA